MKRRTTGQIEYPATDGVLFILTPDKVMYAQGMESGQDVVITYSRLHTVNNKESKDILESYAIYNTTTRGVGNGKKDDTNKKKIDD